MKRAELFFRRVYHLVVGSSLTFYLGSVMKFTCKTRFSRLKSKCL